MHHYMHWSSQFNGTGPKHTVKPSMLPTYWNCYMLKQLATTWTLWAGPMHSFKQVLHPLAQPIHSWRPPISQGWGTLIMWLLLHWQSCSGSLYEDSRATGWQDQGGLETTNDHQESNFPIFEHYPQCWNSGTDLCQVHGDRNFCLYVESMKALVPWFFALDHQNYSRWLLVHIRDMDGLPAWIKIEFKDKGTGLFPRQPRGSQPYPLTRLMNKIIN